MRAGGDFITLCPSWQQMASGGDGHSAAGSPWVLHSTLTNFATNGVAPNQVVWLSGPKSNYPGGGQLLAIDSVSGSSIILRRLYKDLNVGQPPHRPPGSRTSYSRSTRLTRNQLRPRLTSNAAMELTRTSLIADRAGFTTSRTSGWRPC